MHHGPDHGQSDGKELWGTLWGWSEKLGIPEDVLRERFKDLPTEDCVADDRENPGHQIVTVAYPETEVLEAVKDLLARNDSRREGTPIPPTPRSDETGV